MKMTPTRAQIEEAQPGPMALYSGVMKNGKMPASAQRVKLLPRVLDVRVGRRRVFQATYQQVQLTQPLDKHLEDSSGSLRIGRVCLDQEMRLR